MHVNLPLTMPTLHLSWLNIFIRLSASVKPSFIAALLFNHCWKSFQHVPLIVVFFVVMSSVSYNRDEAVRGGGNDCLQT